MDVHTDLNIPFKSLSQKLVSESHNKWELFLKKHKNSLLASIDKELFAFKRLSDRTLTEYFCERGSIVLVKTEYGARFAFVMSAVFNQIQVQFMDDNNEIKWLDSSTLVTSEAALENAKKTYSFDRSKNNLLFNYKFIAKHRTEMSKRVYELIKEGMYLEVQHKYKPQVVFFGQVMENRKGLLLVRIGMTDLWIHMFDPLCHYVGWALDQDYITNRTNFIVDYDYSCRYLDQKLLKAHQVPKALYENKSIVPHDFSIGTCVEVKSRDEKNICYAHVRKIINEHYFLLSVGNSTESEAPIQDYPFYKESPDIFQPGTSEKLSSKPLAPKFTLADKKNVRKWDLYREKYINSKDKESSWKFEKNKRDTQITTLRLIELLDDNVGLFYAAVICRSEGDMIWVQPHKRSDTLIMHIRDPRIYPCGSAKQHNMYIIIEDSVDPKMNQLPDIYTNNPLTAFEDENKSFIPAYCEKSDFVPDIYVNENCNCGPYLSKLQLKKIQSCFSNCLLKDVVQMIYKSIMKCAASEHHRLIIHQIFQRSVEGDDLCPVVSFKYRRGNEQSHVLRAISCGSVDQFPQFLKVILWSISACPCLFGFAKYERNECPYKCGKRNKTIKRKKIKSLKSIKKTSKIDQSSCSPVNSVTARSSSNNTPNILATLIQSENSQSLKKSNISRTVDNVASRTETPTIEPIFESIAGDHRRSLEKKLKVQATNSVLFTPLSSASNVTNPMVVTPKFRPIGDTKPTIKQMTFVKSPFNNDMVRDNRQMGSSSSSSSSPINNGLKWPYSSMTIKELMMLKRPSSSSQTHSNTPVRKVSNEPPQPITFSPSPTSASLNYLQKVKALEHCQMSYHLSRGPRLPENPRLEKPDIESVRKWTAEYLSNYLRQNCMNLGSEAIKTLRMNNVDGNRLIQMSYKDCLEMVPTEFVAKMLHRLVIYINS